MNIPDFYKKYFRPGRISTDSRNIEKDMIFFALKGDNFNGNIYAETALQKGASVAVVDELYGEADARLIAVKDALIFLQDLAKYHRNTSEFNIIGLTGSNGKTTTKELIYSVISEKYSVQSTQGNLNNHVGVPLTLLSFKSDTQYGVVEMGANHRGEINKLCEIAMPDCGLITNIGRAHLEGFGSFEGVIRAKSEIFEYIKNHEGKMYGNGSDPLIRKIVGNYSNLIQYNSENSLCTGRVINSVPSLNAEIKAHTGETVTVKTHLVGDYNLINVLSAACIGLDLDIPLDLIKSAIEKYHPSNLRSQNLQIGSSTVLMDCYNANPTSMELALQNIANHNADKKVVILGAMKELGKYSDEEHNKIASLTDQYGFQAVVLFGKEFLHNRPKKGIVTDSFDELTEYLNSINLDNSVILIKGSRANKLERLEAIIRKHHSLNS